MLLVSLWFAFEDKNKMQKVWMGKENRHKLEGKKSIYIFHTQKQNKQMFSVEIRCKMFAGKSEI